MFEEFADPHYASVTQEFLSMWTHMLSKLTSTLFMEIQNEFLDGTLQTCSIVSEMVLDWKKPSFEVKSLCFVHRIIFTWHDSTEHVVKGACSFTFVIYSADVIYCTALLL